MTDEALIQGCKNNDRKFQELLYKTYFKKMYVMCYRYTTDDMVICDIINDAFLTIFKAIIHFEAKGSFEGWIRKITFNKLADHFRKSKRDIRFMLLEETPFSYKHDHLNEGQDYEYLVNHINSLPQTMKEVFIKYAIEGYNHKEIGNDLGMPESTSRWHLAEARKKLQHLILLSDKKEKLHG